MSIEIVLMLNTLCMLALMLLGLATWEYYWKRWL